MSYRMPAAFIAHGSPMNIIEDNDFTKAVRGIEHEIPRPKAILVVSAHWTTRGMHITCSDNPPQIYDFYGFPKSLYGVEYCPSGSSAIARSISEKAGIGCDIERGNDHASWSILRHMYPEADIPLMSLSLDMTRTARYHFDMGKRLAWLRDEGVLVMGSGNVVHNLGSADMHDMYTNPYTWAVSANMEIREAIETSDYDKLIFMADRTSMAAPTSEHFLPMLYALGMKNEGEKVNVFHDSIQNGSVSMLSFI